MNYLNKEALDYYNRNNKADRWAALLFFGWVASIGGLIILVLLLG